MTEEIELKSYTVLKQLGWNYATYFEGDTIQLEPRFAEFYVNEKVLEELKAEPLSTDSAAPQALPPPSSMPVVVAEEVS